MISEKRPPPRLELGRLGQVKGFGEHAAKIGVNQGEVLDSALLQELAGVAQVIGNVLHQALLGALVQCVHPKIGHLAVVILRITATVPIDIAGNRAAGGQSPGPRALLWSVEGVGEIVGCSVLVVGDVHETIALVVVHLDLVGTVDGYLQVVGSQAMAMSVRVGEETALEHLVGGGLNAGHHVGGAEGDLFHL